MPVEESHASPVVVEAFGDLICPWCYVVRNRFASALEQFDGRQRVEVVWRPVLLAPDAPAEPQSTVDRMTQHFGDRAKVDEVLEALEQIANAEGFALQLRTAVTANTYDAQRLIVGFAPPADQYALVDRLLRAYFVEGRFLGDRDELAALAGDVGLDTAAARTYLDTDLGADAIAFARGRAAEFEVVNVPTYVFNGLTAVRRAQPVDEYLAALHEATRSIGAASAAKGS